ncbi:MAG TPA: hypothetical protein PLO76_07105 [Elusimicrobiota bacterium]|nr:hypothetical protein [Elusimicrobiota bacterium]
MRTRGVWWGVAGLVLVGMKKVDPVDRLVAELSQKPLWSNGTFPIVPLGAKAAPAEVLRKSFESTYLAEGQIKKFRILEIRKVRVGKLTPENYRAALLETDYGRKIVLFRFLGAESGWWTRIFDAR